MFAFSLTYMFIFCMLFLCMGTYLHVPLHGNASQTQYSVSVYGDVSTCISPWQRFSNTVYCFCVWGRIYMYLSMATLLKNSILFLCMGTYLHVSLHGNASQTQYIVSVYGDISTCISPCQRFSNTVYCFCVWGRIYMYLSMATLLKHSILFLCMGTYLHVSLHGNASQTQYIVSVYGDVSTCISPWQRFSNTVYCFCVWGRIYMYLSMATLLKHSILILCMGTYLHVSLHGNVSQTQYIVYVYGDVSTCISQWQRFSNTVYFFCVWGRIFFFLYWKIYYKEQIDDIIYSYLHEKRKMKDAYIKKIEEEE